MKTLKSLAFFRLYFTSIEIALITPQLRKHINKGKTCYQSTCLLLYTYLIIGSRLTVEKRTKNLINPFSLRGKRANGVAIPNLLRIYFTYICQALAGHANRLHCKGAGRLPKKGIVPSLTFLLSNTCLSSAFYAIGSLLRLFCIQRSYKNEAVCGNCAQVYRKFLVCIFFVLVSMFSLSAQTPRKDSGADGLISIKALNVGDTIPQSLWDTPLQVINHPTGQNTIKLSEYRDKKLIILDFWAVWCASCVESLGKIQHKLNYDKSDIVFIPVTLNVDTVVTKFQHSNKVAGEWQFPLVVGDKLLKQIFQHSSISHFVWLSNDGTVLAVTSSEYITDSQLQKGLKGDFADVKMKIDRIDFNVNQPLLVDELTDSKGHYTGFRTFLTGVVPTSGLQSLDSLGLTRRYFVNTTLRSLCMDAMTGIKGVKLTKKKIVYDVEDQNIYFNKMQGNADVWNQKHGLCYEAILPGMTKPSGFRATLKEDLQRHFNIKLTIEERPISVIVLSPGAVKSAIPTNESIELKSLIYSLNLTDNVIPYVICPVDMESVRVPQRLKEYTSPKQFIEMMAKYGVKAQQREQYQQVLVITERRGA